MHHGRPAMHPTCGQTCMMPGIPSLILTEGLFASVEAKTAHGLLRSGDRFAPLAVVDRACAGSMTSSRESWSTPLWNVTAACGLSS